MGRYELLESLNPVPETRGDPGPHAVTISRSRSLTRAKSVALAAALCAVVGLAAAVALRSGEPVQLEITNEPEATASVPVVPTNPEPTPVATTAPIGTTEVTEALDVARFSVHLTLRCLHEGGVTTIGPWPSPGELGYQYVKVPGRAEQDVRLGVEERCTRRFAVQTTADEVTAALMRDELLAEQDAFVDCFNRIADLENQILSPLATDISNEINSLVLNDPGATRRCAARSGDGTSWALKLDSRFDEPIGRLVIPAIDVDIEIREGIEARTLSAPVAGHQLSTELPGQSGNGVIAAHRTTFGSPFSRLDELAVGDPISVTTAQGVFEYLVTGQSVHDPLDTDVLGDFGDNRLTLTTEHPRFSSKQRLVVVAELVGDPVPPFPYIEWRAAVNEPSDPSEMFDRGGEEPGHSAQSMTRAELIDRLRRDAGDVYAGFSAEFGIELFLVGDGSATAAAIIGDAENAGLEITITYGFERSLKDLMTQQHELADALTRAGFADYVIALQQETGRLGITIGSVTDPDKAQLPTEAQAANVDVEFIAGAATGFDS